MVIAVATRDVGTGRETNHAPAPTATAVSSIDAAIERTRVAVRSCSIRGAAAWPGRSPECSFRRNWTTAMSPIRSRASLTRQHCRSVRISAGISAGNTLRSGSRFSTFASVSLTSSPSNGACLSASRTAHSRTPRCRSACPPPAPSLAPATYTRPCPAGRPRRSSSRAT